MLHNLHGLIPSVGERHVTRQFDNVAKTDHVAVHEDRPAFVVAQIRNDEARDAEIGGLVFASWAVVNPFQVLPVKKREAQRNR